MRSSVCSGRDNLVRQPYQVKGQVGACGGGQVWRAIWRVNSSCVVTSAVIVFITRCWHADTPVSCGLLIRMNFIVAIGLMPSSLFYLFLPCNLWDGSNANYTCF